MASFDIAIVKTLTHEGGDKITEIAGDAGGLTKFGISQRAYPHLDIRSLSIGDAKLIYKRDYWDRLNCDLIASQVIAESIFDFAVNAGVTTSAKLAQMCAGVNIDGKIGDNTAKAIDSLNVELFLARFTIAKIARYAHICNKDRAQSKFLLGWILRALGGVQ